MTFSITRSAWERQPSRDWVAQPCPACNERGCRACEHFGVVYLPALAEHTYRPLEGTEGDPFGPLVCAYCGLSAETDTPHPCVPASVVRDLTALDSLAQALREQTPGASWSDLLEAVGQIVASTGRAVE